MKGINRFLREPAVPGPWVYSISCDVCGERYVDFRAAITFCEGIACLRKHNEEINGGFRSRRAVLWAMRVLKLSEWYARHWHCGEAL